MHVYYTGALPFPNSEVWTHNVALNDKVIAMYSVHVEFPINNAPSLVQQAYF